MYYFKFVIGFFLLFAAFALLFFGFVEVFQKGQPSPQPGLRIGEEGVFQQDGVSPQETPPQFLEGTFSQTEFIDDIEIVLEGVEDSPSIRVSWDEGELLVFHIALFDAENIEKRQHEDVVTWFITSVREFPEDGHPVQREQVDQFLSSGYILGQGRDGFEYPEFVDPAQTFEMESGKTYYLKVVGFGSDGNEVTVNKTFTFSVSCLPPNCQ